MCNRATHMLRGFGLRPFIPSTSRKVKDMVTASRVMGCRTFPFYGRALSQEYLIAYVCCQYVSTLPSLYQIYYTHMHHMYTYIYPSKKIYRTKK